LRDDFLQDIKSGELRAWVKIPFETFWKEFLKMRAYSARLGIMWSCLGFQQKKWFQIFGSYYLIKRFNKMAEEIIVPEDMKDVEVVAKEVADFRPSKQMKEFVDWMVNHSSTLKRGDFTIASVAKYSGVGDKLYKWIKDPFFTVWFHREMLLRLGFQISLLKVNIIEEALKEDATLQERKFALEVLNLGKNDSEPPKFNF